MPTSTNKNQFQVQLLDSSCESEINLIAKHMRDSLVDILGIEYGTAMYSIGWLKAKVKWHLNRRDCSGQIFIARDVLGSIVGHTMIQIYPVKNAIRLGLFSMTYVLHSFRKKGGGNATY